MKPQLIIMETFFVIDYHPMRGDGLPVIEMNFYTILALGIPNVIGSWNCHSGDGINISLYRYTS